ncbi:MAG TPA: type IX secretion system membrane protein PorP/SprF [Phaeodactylibacter sp.]|nr:type IX secretion system membrane protein PorP/SprF [Phaeodactylibacter sp.]
MKYLITSLLTTMMLTLSVAQQLPASASFWTTNIENPSLIHPNFIKYDMPLTANASYRYQWVGLKDAPRTALGNFQYFSEDFHFLVGGTLINDVTHPTGFTGLVLNGAYQLEFSQDLYATIGLSGGLYQYRVKGSDLKFLEGGDIASQNVNKLFPDFSVGATLFFQNKYFIGLSVPQTLGLNLNFRKENNDFNIQRVRHYYLTTGAIFSLEDDSWFEPTINVKYLPNIPVLVDVLLKYERQEIFWLGLGGASSGKIHLEAGFILRANGYHNDSLFKLGYAFNQFFGEYGMNFGSAHEIKFTYSKTN